VNKILSNLRLAATLPELLATNTNPIYIDNIGMLERAQKHVNCINKLSVELQKSLEAIEDLQRVY
jgi:hypothetical protein